MVRFATRTVRGKVAAIAAVIGMGSLLVGCGTSATENAFAQPQSTSSVACEPNQRAIVRQVVVNGVPQSQVACETVAPGPTGTTGVVPAAYTPSASPIAYTQLLPNTQFVPANQVVTRDVVAPQRVVYQRAPERRVVSRPKRSLGTSAMIIGGSAAGGAGIGALIGGRKGAGIGALAGGGAAALWDQITRRKN